MCSDTTNTFGVHIIVCYTEALVFGGLPDLTRECREYSKRLIYVTVCYMKVDLYYNLRTNTLQ